MRLKKSTAAMSFLGGLVLLVSVLSCSSDRESTGTDEGTNPGNTDTSDGTDSDSLPDTDPVAGKSYIWIANTGEGTVSKIDTRLEIELARYITSPIGAIAEGDPSRTTVNRHGDPVVLNRRHPSQYDASKGASATKYAASLDECTDRNSNQKIDTSESGTDVKPWGDDECMLWHTSLGVGVRGARAAAWDGQENPKTGLGGHVWIGTCEKLENPGAQDYIFKLNGNTGQIMETIEFGGCAYGAAMASDGSLWIVDRDAAYAVHRLDTKTLVIETFPTSAGYGIAIDSKGAIWATGDAGLNKVSRYDPKKGVADTLTLDPVFGFPRGAGAGVRMSAGYVWVAENSGYLLKFDESNFTLADAYPMGLGGAPSTIGIGVDADGYIWVVSQGQSAVFKFDPVTETYVTIPVGQSPYTYSDMTGIQLLNQIPPI